MRRALPERMKLDRYMYAPTRRQRTIRNFIAISMHCPFFDVHPHDDELNDDAHHAVEGWIRIQLMRAIWQNEPKCPPIAICDGGVDRYADRDGDRIADGHA